MSFLHYFNTRHLTSNTDCDLTDKICTCLRENGIWYYVRHYMISDYADYRFGSIFYIATPFDYTEGSYLVGYDIRVHRSQYEKASELMSNFK